MTDADDRRDGRAAWSAVGPSLAADVCDRRRADVDGAFRDLVASWQAGEDIDAEDLRQARETLNAARRFLEDVAAPVAGGEPWGARPPSVPVGAIREHYGQIRPTDDVDEE